MKCAALACIKHAQPLAVLMLGQMMLRLIALAPAALAFLGMIPESMPAWIYYLFTLLLYLFLVMPFRFYAGGWMGHFANESLPAPKRPLPYFLWLRRGGLRLLRGLPWGIPCLGVIGYMVIGPSVLPFNEMWKPVQNLAVLFSLAPTLLDGILAGLPLFLALLLLFCFGWPWDMTMECLPLQGPPRGIPCPGVIGYLAIGPCVLLFNDMWKSTHNLAVPFGMEPTLLNGILAGLPLFLLLVLLFCFGWLWDMPMEYLPLQGKQAWHAGKWRGRLGSMMKNFAVNTLLFLPALAGIMAVIVPYIFAHVDFSGNLVKTIRDMTKLMDQPLPLFILLALAGIFFVVYLPLCTLRKMRNALLANRMTGDKNAA